MSAHASGDLSALLAEGLAEKRYAGAVLRIERGGRLLFEEAVGHALADGPKRIVMKADSIFDLASVTKLFTAAAILRLVSTGACSLGSRVLELLEHSALGTGMEAETRERLRASLGAIDLESLLSHSSGLHYWYPFYTRRGQSFESVLARVMELHPRQAGVVYSDLNFMLLGRIVEAVTGKALAAAVSELVFEPLGLTRTSFRRPLGQSVATEAGNRIEEGMVAALGLTFDRWRDRGLPILGEPNDGNCHYYFDGTAGHAGVFSDARDLCRLGQSWLDGGVIMAPGAEPPGSGKRWIHATLAAEALRDRGGGRGLGFQTGENYPGSGCGHTGFTGSYLHINPPSGLNIALLANRLHVAEPGDINPFRKRISECALANYPRP
ncbi:MAG: serine hydrolase domain-containing protein [Rectinemataceae bacterium]